MSETYPLSLPAEGAITAIRLVKRRAQAAHENAFTFAEDIYDYPGRQWVAQVSLRRMNAAEAKAWSAFFARLDGRVGTFLLGSQLKAQPKGNPAGTPRVKGAGQTGGELLTDGWTPDAPLVLAAGDHIQIGSGLSARLYEVKENVDADAGGEATLKLWPRLYFAHADDEPIVTAGARGLFRLDQSDDSSDETRRKWIDGVSFTGKSVIDAP